MRCLKVLAAAVVTVCLACGPLRAAFIDDQVKPTLPTKWSQLVDVDNGHDVYSFWQGGNDFPTTVVADDWKCPDGLPITDVHWWGSYIQGSPGGPTHQGGMLSFELSIHTDIPADNVIPSHPGTLLWSREFAVGPVVQEVFYSPGKDRDIYQYTLVLPPLDNFPQVKDTIYWLNIIARTANDNTIWGWHTSVRPGPLDPAVLIYDYDPFSGVYSRWLSLFDSQCYTAMAFELTSVPEPATLGLVGVGALTLTGVIRRRRKR